MEMGIAFTAKKVRPRHRVVLFLFLAWACVTVFSRLGDAPVYIENEAREGIYIRAMLETGNFVLPDVPDHVECGETIPDKPPLFHWLGAATTFTRSWLVSGRVIGGAQLSRDVDEWVIRFPSALTGILTVLAMVTAARYVVGMRAAILAAACLLTSWQFIHQSRYGRVDMAAAAFTTWTMLLLGRALLTSRRWPLAVAAVTSGLAVLSKGPLGLVLPVLGGGTWIAIASVRRRSVQWLRRYPWFSAALLFGLVVVPWYAAACRMNGPALYRSQILTENVRQFTGTNGRSGFMYYVLPYLTDSIPWNLVALGGLVMAFRRRDRGAMFCAVWWSSFMVFFTLAAYKRKAYILPALPASSLLAGYWLDAKLPALDDSLVRCGLWLRSHREGLVVGGVTAAALGAVVLKMPAAESLLGVDLRVIDAIAATLGMTAFAAAAGWLIYAVRVRNGWLALVSVWVGLTGLYLGTVVTGETVAALKKTPKPLVHRIVQELPKGQGVTLLGVGDDASMLLLLYFPEWSRITIVPQRSRLPHRFHPGYYLFARPAWQALTGASDIESDHWQVLWSADLRERGKQIPLVMVRNLPRS